MQIRPVLAGLTVSLLAVLVPTATAEGRGDVRLHNGPYGFLVPVGWRESPLTNYGGSGEFASFTANTTSAGLILYEVGSAAGPDVYKPNHAPNPLAAAGPIPGPQGARRCKRVTDRTLLASNIAEYTCTSRAGVQTMGVTVIEPYPQGFRQLQVSLPVGDPATDRILGSFRATATLPVTGLPGGPVLIVVGIAALLSGFLLCVFGLRPHPHT
jgi:hypothetical protein